jgi:hypothetical protein
MTLTPHVSRASASQPLPVTQARNLGATERDCGRRVVVRAGDRDELERVASDLVELRALQCTLPSEDFDERLVIEVDAVDVDTCASVELTKGLALR